MIPIISILKILINTGLPPLPPIRVGVRILKALENHLTLLTGI
jgi:hypothetical protein